MNAVGINNFFIKIRIWEIPTEGLTSNLNESLVELQGHMRKVLQVEWHPTAHNVLISIGFDQSVSEKLIYRLSIKSCAYSINVERFSIYAKNFELFYFSLNQSNKQSLSECILQSIFI